MELKLRRVDLNKGSADKILRIYPTLQCNMQCSYCSNGSGGGSLPSAKPELWVKGLVRLQSGQFSGVHITGGEPLMYPGLADLINAIPSAIGVIVYTNLTIPPDTLLRKLKREVGIRGSLHSPGGLDVYRTHVDMILKSNMVDYFVLIVVDGSPSRVAYLRHFNRISGTKLVISENQWVTSAKHKTCGVPRRVICKNRIYLYGPDGARYPCVTYMRRGWRTPDPVFWETDWQFVQREVRTECNEYGCCCACDGIIDSSIEFME